MIRALIFDCFGVLYRDNLSMLYDAVPRDKHQAMQDIIHATDHGFLTRPEYYQAIAELAGITPDDVRAIESRQHSRDEEMIDFARSFKPRYKIALLSNIDTGTIHRLFPDTEREQLFDAFVVSGEVGLTKPSLEIFQLAAEKLGLLPEECIMIDDIPTNIEAARMVGMHGVLFTSRHKLEQDLQPLLQESSDA